MNSKIDEPFNPDIKSPEYSRELQFKKADSSHVDDIFEFMSIRNPLADKDKLYTNTMREVTELNDGIKYGVFVAILNSKVVGFCRYYTTDNVPKEKIKFAYPEGMFCMGIMIRPNFRRQGIAKFINEKRFEKFRTMNIDEVYSAVDEDNLTSISMHNSFGFQEISRIPGVLNIDFDGKKGILFRKSLNK